MFEPKDRKAAFIDWVAITHPKITISGAQSASKRYLWLTQVRATKVLMLAINEISVAASDAL